MLEKVVFPFRSMPTSIVLAPDTELPEPMFWIVAFGLRLSTGVAPPKVAAESVKTRPATALSLSNVTPPRLRAASKVTFREAVSNGARSKVAISGLVVPLAAPGTPAVQFKEAEKLPAASRFQVEFEAWAAGINPIVGRTHRA